MKDSLGALVEPLPLLLELSQDLQARLDARRFFSGNRQDRLGILARLLSAIVGIRGIGNLGLGPLESKPRIFRTPHQIRECGGELACQRGG